MQPQLLHPAPPVPQMRKGPDLSQPLLQGTSPQHLQMHSLIIYPKYPETHLSHVPAPDDSAHGARRNADDFPAVLPPARDPHTSLIPLPQVLLQVPDRSLQTPQSPPGFLLTHPLPERHLLPDRHLLRSYLPADGQSLPANVHWHLRIPALHVPTIPALPLHMPAPPDPWSLHLHPAAAAPPRGVP